MNEMVIDFEDIQKTLEPYYAGKTVKVITYGNNIHIFEQVPQAKILKSRGILSNYANPDMIPGEKGAWERAVVEKYANNNS